MTNTNNKLKALQSKVEDNIVKNEHSKAILESICDTFDDVVKHSNTEGEEHLVVYEFGRIATRTEILFNLLQDFLIDSSKLNDQTIEQIMELKREEKSVD